MKKLLYAIGDSWTYGSDLENPTIECYPYNLSKRLDCDLINEAKPAASNDWIFRKSVEWIATNNTSNIHTFIVGWTMADRREEHFKFFHGGPPKWERKFNWHQNKDGDLSKFISENLSNMRLQAIKTFTYMYALQELLKKNNVNYIFYFPWEDLLLQDEWYETNIKKDVHDIYLKIDKKYCVEPLYTTTSGVGKEMLEKGLHPDKNQHILMSNKLYENIIGRII